MAIKLKILLYSFLILYTNTVLSQLDSLNKLMIHYKNIHNDTLLFDVAEDLISIHTKKTNLKAVDSLYMVLDNIEIGNLDLKRQSNYYTDKVKFYGMRRKFEEAQECVEKAITINQEIQDTSKLIANYFNLATIQMMTDKLKEASKTYFSALDIATRLKDTVSQAKIYCNLSGLYYKLHASNKGIEYARKSIQNTDKQDYSSMAQAYTNLSINLYQSESVTVDSVISIMQKTIKLYEKVPNKIGIAKESNNIGTLLWKTSRFEEALPYLKNAEKNYLDIDKEALLESNYISQGKYYSKVSDFKNTESYFKKALSLNNLSLNHKVSANENLGHVYKDHNKKNLAIYHYGEALTLKDSIYNVSIDNIIFETEAKYETEKREQEIILLQKDQEISDAQIQRQNSLLLGGGMGLIGSAFGLFYLFTARRKEKELYKRDIAGLERENKEWYEKVQRYRATKQKIAIRNEDVIKINGDGPVIQILELIYVQSQGNYVNIYVKGKDKPILLRYPLSKFHIEYLPQNVFARVNNSTIINLNNIVRKRASAIFVDDSGSEKQFNIGRAFKEEFQKLYDDLPNA